MRSSRISLATQRGAVRLGDKQAVAREEGRGHLFRRDFSRPLISLGVVRFGRGVVAAGWSLLLGERGKEPPRRTVEVAERVRDGFSPMPAKWCGPERFQDPARRV